MVCIDLILKSRLAVFSEKHWTFNLVLFELASFNLEAAPTEIISDNAEYSIAS